MSKIWHDKYGNMLPNSRQTSSEDPSTFNAVLCLLDESIYPYTYDDVLIKRLNRAKWETNNGRYMTNEHDNVDDFSLDEAISVAAISRRWRHHENLQRIELFGRSYSLRPDTFCFLLLCKYPIFNLALLPRLFVSASMVISCMRKREDTSGKQLAYIRYRGLNMKWTWWLCTHLLTNSSWAEVFQIYYPESDHPINVLARKVWP